MNNAFNFSSKNSTPWNKQTNMAAIINSYKINHQLLHCISCLVSQSARCWGITAKSAHAQRDYLQMVRMLSAITWPTQIQQLMRYLTKTAMHNPMQYRHVIKSTLLFQVILLLASMISWARANKMIMNLSKTREIFFRWPGLRHFVNPPPTIMLNRLQTYNYKL